MSLTIKNNCRWSAVSAVVQDYAPAIVQEGYLLEGHCLEQITATTRPDNPSSVKILEHIGMHKIKEEEKYNALRYHFSISLNEITIKDKRTI